MSTDIRNSEETDVDKGPFLHVSSSGLVAAEDLHFSNSEITGLPQYELVVQYLTLFAPVRYFSLDVDRFRSILELKVNTKDYCI